MSFWEKIFPNKNQRWQNFFDEYKWPLGLGLIGLTLVIYGLFAHFSVQEPTVVEIVPAEEGDNTESVWVDIEGAVEKPGVYELPPNSRISHLLIRAGGLAANADRNWVEKNVNLAQKLVDGSKLYVPREQEAGQLPVGSSQVAGEQVVIGQGIGSQININTASTAELDTLWGIGEARAASIIAGRPYQAIEELENKNIIPSNVFERIRDLICVY